MIRRPRRGGRQRQVPGECALRSKRVSQQCVVILGDMEGVTGVGSWDQVSAGKDEYGHGRRLYTGDINAAVRGCKAAGVARIIAQDGHGAGGSNSFRSWLVDLLEPGAEYVLGHKWAAYVEAFEAGCDAVVLIGAHAMAGQLSCLSHTISGNILNFRLNGQPVSESTLLAALAGHWNVPVALISGDDVVCADARAVLGERLGQAVVKHSTGRYSVRSLCAADGAALIEANVAECLRRGDFPEPFRPSGPVELRVEILQPEDRRAYLDGRDTSEEGREVVARGADFLEAWRRFWPY